GHGKAGGEGTEAAAVVIEGGRESLAVRGTVGAEGRGERLDRLRGQAANCQDVHVGEIARGQASGFPADGALVPAAKEEVRDQAGRGEDRDAGERQEDEGRGQARE